MRYHAVLFDLDGTLVDSLPDLATAANLMRQDLGLSLLQVEQLSHFVGKGMDNLIKRTLSARVDFSEPDEALFTRAKSLFVQHYHAVNGQQSVLYPGVLEGLERLRSLGLSLAVVTNKPAQFTLPLLKQMRLAGFFEEVVSGDTCPHKKPHPEPLWYACQQLGVNASDTVFIGDSMNDASAAQAAQMDVLILPYGYNEGKSVQNLSVSAIVQTVDLAVDWIIAQ